MRKNRITINPNIHFGQSCIARTRIPVHYILELVQTGISFDEIVTEYYPDITIDDIKACVQHAIDVIKSEELSRKKQSEGPSSLTDFEEGVHRMVQTFRQFGSNTGVLPLQERLRAQIQALLPLAKEQADSRRHLLAMLSIALRRAKNEPLNGEKLFALEQVAEKLLEKEPSFEEVATLRRQLALAGIDVLPSFGKFADELVRLAEAERMSK